MPASAASRFTRGDTNPAGERAGRLRHGNSTGTTAGCSCVLSEVPTDASVRVRRTRNLGPGTSPPEVRA
jgi:hypothetical protein